MKLRIRTNILFLLYFILFVSFSIYSYAFLDVGLTLTSIKPYLQFQKKMQWFGYFNRPASTYVFIIISILVYLLYFFLYKTIKKQELKLNNIILAALLIGIILLLAYPAFSHDIFNYIFNAKMVLVFKADPHKQVAMDFPDPMLGFMRNIHTPAPYFYGWTIISLIPALISFNRIFVSLINFKIFSFLLFFFTFFVLQKVLNKLRNKDNQQRLLLFLLNPLILIETIGVGHNDLSMMLPALASFLFLIKYKEKKQFKFLIFSILLILFSISTKYASVILLPLLFYYFLKPSFDIGLWGAIALFVLPFSRPLDQLHSWYLIWPLTWSFLAKDRKIFYFFSFLSFFALLRYWPYIYYGDWDPPVPNLRLLIYFFVPGLAFLFFMLKEKLILRKKD